jgi:hypothetical protein
MANNAQANWNMVRIVYGSKDPFVNMVDKEHTCLFHWTQSFDKHTKTINQTWVARWAFRTLRGRRFLGLPNNLLIVLLV